MSIDIKSIKRRLLIKYPTFGSIVAGLEFQEDFDMPTAATDGKRVLYNPEFLKGLTEKQQMFVFAHELFHIALNHIYRSEGKNLRLWNIATDAVANSILKKDGLELVEGCIDMPEAINYDAEGMYEKLLKEEKDKQNQQNSQDNKKQQDSQNNQENQKDDKNQQNDKGQSEKDDVGHDTHGMWENAIEDRKKEKSEEEKTEFSELEGKGVLERIKKERKKQFKEFNKKLINESAQEVKDEKEKIGQGKKISDIGVAVPLIDWRRRLRQATKYKEEYTMRNSRLKNGLFTYRVEQIPIPETEILLDVSGSVSEILLRNFLRECKNILSESQVKVGCFNTQFYGFTKLRSTKDIDNMTFPIGGGTDFNVAVEAFSRNIPNKIIFTDGLAPMPKKTERNVIWVVYGKEKFYPKGGEVINIIGEQLKKLCELHVETKEVMSK